MPDLTSTHKQLAQFHKVICQNKCTLTNLYIYIVSKLHDSFSKDIKTNMLKVQLDNISIFTNHKQNVYYYYVQNDIQYFILTLLFIENPDNAL